MKSKLSLVCLSLCLLVVLGSHRSVGAADETRQVEVTGTAAAANEVTAEKLARENALREAVRQVTGKELDDIDDVMKYVATSRVLSKRWSADSGTMRIKMLITVRTDIEEADKKRNLYLACHPRFMVIVPETLLDRPRVPDPAGETEINRVLLEKRYRVVDSSDVKVIRYTQDVNRIIESADVAAMKKLGAKYEADILVVGEAFAQEIDGGRPGFRNALSRVEVKAFQVSSGVMLATNGAQKGGAEHTVELAAKASLKNSGKAIADYLIEQFDKMLREDLVMELSVHGLRKQADLDRFKEGVKAIPDVARLFLRNFEPDNDIATFEVNSTACADEISSAIGKMEGFRTKVVSISADKIEINATPAAGRGGD